MGGEAVDQLCERLRIIRISFTAPYIPIAKTRGFTAQPDKGEINEETIENHHFRYPGRIWRYLVYRKPEAPGHDSARISRRVKCEKTSKLCWKSSGIWSCRCLFLYLTLDIGMGI